MRNYSITEVAQKLEVERATLYAWIRAKKIPAPTTQVISGVRFRFWTEADIKKIKEYKAGNYWGKGQNRKKKK